MTAQSISRRTALVIGTVIMLCYGVIYAWSIYSVPLAGNFQWTSAQLGRCFTVIMTCFCLGGILGSGIAGKTGPARTLLVGGLLSLAGYLLACLLNSRRLGLLYMAFGLAGLGCGVVYNTVLSSVISLYDDKRGFASGVMLMGFGASTLLVGSLAASLMQLPGSGWRGIYAGTGVLLFLTALCGSTMVSRIAPADKKTPEPEDAGGCRTEEMLHTPSFWLFFFIAALLSFFGQGIIGHARGIAVGGGVSESLSTTTVGLVSVANGAGRIFFGSLHDRKGFRTALLTDAVLLIAAGSAVALCLAAKSPAVVAALILCGFGYGAPPPISSSVTREFFGKRYYARNFSIVNLSIILASTAATIMGRIQTVTGSYFQAIVSFTVLELVSILLILLLSRVRRGQKP
ncbi:MAG: MFS transporter [Oscillospiraceae bacterium]|nr:MFS transporter [Oscillospiraceae bacterium]